MNDNQQLTAPDVIRLIQKKRKIFENYNIRRMNDLMIHLSAHKSKLFNMIPFLLHINSPDFPGYINDDACIYGIFGFHDSAFWKIILKQKKIDEKFLSPYLSKKYHIVGLYLMGSSGTLAQSKRSDFDYWVLIDRTYCNKDQVALLNEKLKKIKKWSYEKFEHDVNFFILDANDIKNNRYTAVDEESSGTAQRTILKEEFYRTFILVAGKVPFWAVFPICRDDEMYREMVALSIQNDPDNHIRETYIDLGNLNQIRKNECPGAILWQLNKANIDPAKALVKAGLITYFNFFPKSHKLPCDCIKERYAETVISSSLSDPYAIMFDRVITFLDGFSDGTYSEIIRECIFLRLSGYLSTGEKDMHSPRAKLLKSYLQIWGWKRTQTEKFYDYANWSESEKYSYDEKVINKISLLYNAVMKQVDKNHSKIDMKGSDFQNLRNRIAKYYKIKPGKLPRCSTFLKADASRLTLRISNEILTDRPQWTVYNAPATFKGSPVPLYESRILMKSIGWIIANHLFSGNPQAVTFQQTIDGITAKIARRLFFRSYQLLKTIPLHEIDFMVEPKPYRLFAVLDTESFYAPDSFKNCELLVQNTWGEFFYTRLTLDHIKSGEKKCQEIARFIFRYIDEAYPQPLNYEIIHLKVHKDNNIIQKIKEMVARMNPNKAADSPDINILMTLGNRDVDEPFLLDR